MTSRYLAPWRVDIDIRPSVARPLPVRISALVRAVAVALDAARAPAPASIGLILSDDEELAELNARHLGHEGPTDVLSFPLLPRETFVEPPHAEDGGASRAGVSVAKGGSAVGTAGSPHVAPLVPSTFTGPPGRRLHLGDIVVSVERAVEQAREGRGGQTGDVRWSARDELRLLVTHGALHICGWDHAEPADERAMRDLEGQLLASG